VRCAVPAVFDRSLGEVGPVSECGREGKSHRECSIQPNQRQHRTREMSREGTSHRECGNQPNQHQHHNTEMGRIGHRIESLDSGRGPNHEAAICLHIRSGLLSVYTFMNPSRQANQNRSEITTSMTKVERYIAELIGCGSILARLVF
jgi:hypothetical protein